MIYKKLDSTFIPDQKPFEVKLNASNMGIEKPMPVAMVGASLVIFLPCTKNSL
jgi:hypothetical protein